MGGGGRGRRSTEWGRLPRWSCSAGPLPRRHSHFPHSTQYLVQGSEASGQRPPAWGAPADAAARQRRWAVKRVAAADEAAGPNALGVLTLSPSRSHASIEHGTEWAESRKEVMVAEMLATTRGKQGMSM
eukprot:364743-Chlamydomonas_euryale.AAC.116